MKHKAMFIVSVIFLFMSSTAVYSDIPQNERDALIALYNNTNGDNWTNNSGWKTPPLHTDGFAMPGTEKDWYGVTCDGGNTMVVRILLNENGLIGEIPAQLGNLSNLVTLSLRHNQIGKNQEDEPIPSKIPPELGNLSKLQGLYLHRNFLNGSIPKELGNLSELKELYLYENELTGDIPEELGSLLELRKLHLYKNKLTGDIPKVLGSLPKLTILNLRSNYLLGSIPQELGNLSNLESLYLYDNQLTGKIPPELGSLSKLTDLYLNNNHLEKSIPSELGNLSELEIIQLSSNKLKGSIPTNITEDSLPKILRNRSDFRRNALYTNNDTVRDLLDKIQAAGGWENYQTVAPKGVTARATSAHSVEVSWESIAYTFEAGRYKVFYSQTSGGPYTSDGGATENKSKLELKVTGLKPLTTYYFVVQTETDPIPRKDDIGDFNFNENTVKSDYSDEASVTTPHIDKIISGRVSEETGEGVEGVILFFSPNEFEKTKADGTYRHTVKHGWSGTVEPTKTGYYFEPEKRSFTNVTSHQTGINFTAIKIPLTISGKVSDTFGDGVDGVTLTFTSYNGEKQTETTGPDGIYTHPVNYGWSGTVTPSKYDLLFDPQENNHFEVKASVKDEDYHLAITLFLTASRDEERTFLVKKDYIKVNLTVFLNKGFEDKVEEYIICRADSDGGQTEIPIKPSDISEGEPYTYYDRYLEKNVSYTYKVEARAQDKVIGESNTVTK